MADTEVYKAERLEAGVGPATVNGELRTFLTVLGWAKRQGYPVTFPPVRYLREPKGRVRIWTRPEVDALMGAARAKHPQLLRMIVFLLNTGCRKGRLIRIPASREWSPKSGRAREVPMSDACRAVLQLPELERLSDRWVFPNRDGVRFEFFPDAIFKELQTKAGVTGGAHTLRHCYASNFLQKTRDMFALSKILGHSHQRTTELYSHLLPGHLAKSRNAVNIGPPPTMAGTAGKAAKKRKSA
jgi:integrase